jgi:outer membrane protein assembly factor BamA
VTGGYLYLNERYENAGLQQVADDFQQANGQRLFRNGHMLPLGVAFVQETTVFRDYGPVAGSTLRFGYEASPPIGNNWIARQTLEVDARHYMRLGTNGVFALRFKGFNSWGNSPDFIYFGGNSEMRGYDYLQFIGHKAFFANAELRFPLIEAMLTPVGVLGGLRGTFFFNVSGAGYQGFPFTFSRSDTEIITPTLGYEFDDLGNLIPIQGTPIVVDGFRLVDGRASYGIGLQSFLLGFPMHFDWSYRTLFNKGYEDALFFGGSEAFRKVRFSFWIGYDF